MLGMDVLEAPISDDAAFQLRTYQHEMLQKSLERNVIIAVSGVAIVQPVSSAKPSKMDTGSGKTHVAIARVQIELERSDPTQLVWFLCPKVALSGQQYQMLRKNLPAYHIISLTGNDGIENWSDSATWEAALHNVRAVVGTPQVLCEALTHGFVAMSRLSLLVFDEAHNCRGKAAENRIMQLFYFPRKESGKRVPHILGLTASPVTQPVPNALRKIEASLNAITVTPKVHASDLRKHANRPEFEQILYEDQLLSSPQVEALCAAANEYDFQHDPYVLRLKELGDPASCKALETVILNRATFCSCELRALVQRAINLTQELGPSMASWYVSACVSIFDTLRIDSTSHSILSEFSDKERQHLQAILRPWNDEVPLHDLQLSQKAVRLVQLLEKKSPVAFKGIIFVEQRAMVVAVAKLLKSVTSLAAYTVTTFVGTSASTKRKHKIADLAVTTAKHDLESFRNNRSNLIVATSVLEEGIDISACNTVICFDLPKNLVAYVQRRGRARQQHAVFNIFLEQNDKTCQIAQWQQMEQVMKDLYQQNDRELIAEDAAEVSMPRTYIVQSTGAILTFENAKAHLYNFCATGIMHGTHIDMRPEFDPVFDSESKLWTANVHLPAFIHASLRITSSSQPWQSAKAANNDAAFQAYVRLHQAGLVNDNLLARVRDYGPELGELHVDQPKMLRVQGRGKPFASVAQRSVAHPNNWYHSQICLHESTLKILSMDLWTPAPLGPPQDFEIFFNDRVTYNCSVVSSADVTQLGVAELQALRRSTELILSSIHGHRMCLENNDFVALLAPSDVDDVASWVKENEQSDPCCFSGLSEIHSSLDYGLIRWQDQVGKNFFFRGQQESLDASGDQMITVSAFPRRRDFLHKVLKFHEASPAYTVTFAIAAKDCTVQRLPSRYALFAAFFPSIMHRLDIVIHANEFAHQVMPRLAPLPRHLLVEVLSVPCAREATDYNRLEYLGDSILKFCTALQVSALHLNWPEAYLTLGKDRIVRNSNLTNAALRAGVDKYILTEQFTGAKWRPPYIHELSIVTAEEGREVSSKVLADVIEALIGAAFVYGGIEKAFAYVKALLHKEQWLQQIDCITTIVADYTPAQLDGLAVLERMTCHDFQNKSLLLEAITHASYRFQRNGASYERLEFLGDAVLDLVIIPKLFMHSKKFKHWELHRLREALVNGYMLGFLCMKYCIQEDEYRVTKTTPSQAQGNEIQQRQHAVHLHDFLRMSEQLLLLKRTSTKTFAEKRTQVEQQLSSSNEYPWCDLIAIQAPKFFSDIIESIIGALFLDSKGDLGVVERFVDALGLFDLMNHFMENDIDTWHPKEKVGMVANQDKVTYKPDTYVGDDGNRYWGCRVQFDTIQVAEVSRCSSREEAEARGAYEAAKFLQRVPADTGKKSRKRSAEVMKGKIHGSDAL